MPFDELPNGEGWIAAALPSALYPVSQLYRQRVEVWKAALRGGTLEWQLWADHVCAAVAFTQGGEQSFASDRIEGCSDQSTAHHRVTSTPCSNPDAFGQ